MRLDYSDKVGAVRESAERRPVPKNRPRKAPVGIFAFLGILLLLGLTFGAGVLTGWYLKGEVPAAGGAPAAAVQQQEPAPAAAQPAAAAPDAPLTFYKTLPSGGQGAMGSGVNLKLAEPPQPRSAPAAAPAADSGDEKQEAEKQVQEKTAAEKQAQEKPAAAKPAPEKGTEKQAGGGRFLVQIASYRDRKEAEAVQAKLNAKGVAAYLVESKVQDKGVWWRLRAGRHLSKEEAERLAGKVGSGAAVLAE